MSQGIFRGVLGVAVLLCPGVEMLARAPAPPPRPRPLRDRQRIVGTWQAVEVHANGIHLAYEVSDKQTWVISEDRITIRYDGCNDYFVYKLDPLQSPRAIDLEPVPGTLTHSSYLAVYELDGDRLAVHRSRVKRPARMSVLDIERGQAVIILKRVGKVEGTP